jgi:hypothetical protein
VARASRCGGPSGRAALTQVASRERPPSWRIERGDSLRQAPRARHHTVTTSAAFPPAVRTGAMSGTSLRLAQGSLVRAGDSDWEVLVNIRVFRPSARQSRAAEAFRRQVNQNSSSAGNQRFRQLTSP